FDLVLLRCALTSSATCLVTDLVGGHLFALALPFALVFVVLIGGACRRVFLLVFLLFAAVTLFVRIYFSEDLEALELWRCGAVHFRLRCCLFGRFVSRCLRGRLFRLCGLLLLFRRCLCHRFFLCRSGFFFLRLFLLRCRLFLRLQVDFAQHFQLWQFLLGPGRFLFLGRNLRLLRRWLSRWRRRFRLCRHGGFCGFGDLDLGRFSLIRRLGTRSRADHNLISLLLDLHRLMELLQELVVHLIRNLGRRAVLHLKAVIVEMLNDGAYSNV